MKSLPKVVLFIFSIGVIFQPGISVAQIDRNDLAKYGMLTFFASSALLMTGAFFLGKSTENTITFNCPPLTNLACCSLKDQTFSGCQFFTQPCPDQLGPVCFFAADNATALPQYELSDSSRRIGIVTVLLGAFGLVASFVIPCFGQVIPPAYTEIN